MKRIELDRAHFIEVHYAPNDPKPSKEFITKQSEGSIETLDIVNGCFKRSHRIVNLGDGNIGLHDSSSVRILADSECMRLVDAMAGKLKRRREESELTLQISQTAEETYKLFMGIVLRALQE